MATPHVVVVGGGFAGLETAFFLRHRLHDAVDITLVSDQERFVYRPNSIYLPFGAEPESILIDLEAPLRRRHVTFYRDRAIGLDPDRRHVVLKEGVELPYDFAVVATGATMRPDEIPGLKEHASTIWTIDEMLRLRTDLANLTGRARRGERQDVLFVVPPNNKCSGPLYEIAFMLDTWLRREKIHDLIGITYSTYERSFIQAFGPRLHEVVLGEFADRGIQGHTEEPVEKVTDGEVAFANGQTRPFDHLISFPPYAAAVSYDALPTDDRGFIQAELETRQVVGLDRVYAPGDGGDFPVKQAFLAFLQADAVAEHIAAQVEDREFAHPFDPTSM